MYTEYCGVAKACLSDAVNVLVCNAEEVCGTKDTRRPVEVHTKWNVEYLRLSKVNV
jgi:hypothetical protein